MSRKMQCQIAFVGLLAILFMSGPELGNSRCSVGGSRIGTSRMTVTARSRQHEDIVGVIVGVPPVGSFYGLICTAAMLLIFMLRSPERFYASIPLHFWARLYVIAVSIQAAMQISNYWVLFVFCFRNTSAWLNVSTTLFLVSFFASELFLCKVAVLRLRAVASAGSGRIATQLLNVLLVIALLLLTSRAGSIRFAGSLVRSYVQAIFGSVFLLVWVIFQLQVLISFGVAAHGAQREVKRGHSCITDQRTAKRAAVTVALLAASAGTTLLFGVAGVLWPLMFGKARALEWFMEVCMLLHWPFDAFLLLICTGLLGPSADQERELFAVRRLSTNLRVRIMLLLTSARWSACGPALVLAALCEGEAPEQLIESAIARFRCITWDTLSQRPDVILCRASLDGQAASSELYDLSEPCDLGDCDAFVSHSWHDDCDQKWEALRTWCETFLGAYQRTPLLWLDKVCINQQQIKRDLACLPVFLAGCDRLLVLSGSTYSSRLWCCVELFVHAQVAGSEKPTILSLGGNDSEREDARTQWASFDAASCDCFNQADKVRMVSVIDCYPGGMDHFNDHVKGIFSDK